MENGKREMMNGKFLLNRLEVLNAKEPANRWSPRPRVLQRFSSPAPTYSALFLSARCAQVLRKGAFCLPLANAERSGKRYQEENLILAFWLQSLILARVLGAK